MKIKEIQIILGQNNDGIWGPKSQDALNAEIEQTIDANDKIEKIQNVLGVDADGIWGYNSQAALNNEISDNEGFSCDASSFADPADLVGFKKCKETGKSDVQCFAVGDNGIGQFGKITSQEEIPMVAVNKETMIAKWGSVHGAAHRPVEVTVRGLTISATVEDRISEPGRIDLNPACAKKLGLHPPFVVKCFWRWAT